ncbi:MAG TPA: hypothetical protein DCE81_10080 [Cytophagales bacterium]|nr:hypothetical protein [Cytophagales bacterium]
MNTEVKSGIKESFIFYTVAVVLTVFSYGISDNSYAHGLHLYMVVALIFIAVGVFIGMMSLVKYIFFVRNLRMLGVAIVHSVVLVVFLLWIYFGLVNRS